MPIETTPDGSTIDTGTGAYQGPPAETTYGQEFGEPTGAYPNPPAQTTYTQADPTAARPVAPAASEPESDKTITEATVEDKTITEADNATEVVPAAAADNKTTRPARKASARTRKGK